MPAPGPTPLEVRRRPPPGAAGAGAEPPDTGAIDSAGVASAPKNPEASAVAAHGSTLADGRRIAPAPGSAGPPWRVARPPGSPGPRSPTRPAGQYAVQSETVGARAVRARRRRRRPWGRAGGSRPPRRRGATAPRRRRTRPRRRPPPGRPTARTAPIPASRERRPGGGERRTSHLPVPTTDETETPDPLLLLRFLLVLGFRRVRPGNVLEHPLRRAAPRRDPGRPRPRPRRVRGRDRREPRDPPIPPRPARLLRQGRGGDALGLGPLLPARPGPDPRPPRPPPRPPEREPRAAPRRRSATRRASRGSDLADRLGVAGPSVTRQVQRLIEEGLVEAERCGRSTCYRLTAGVHRRRSEQRSRRAPTRRRVAADQPPGVSRRPVRPAVCGELEKGAVQVIRLPRPAAGSRSGLRPASADRPRRSWPFRPPAEGRNCRTGRGCLPGSPACSSPAGAGPGSH